MAFTLARVEVMVMSWVGLMLSFSASVGLIST